MKVTFQVEAVRNAQTVLRVGPLWARHKVAHPHAEHLATGVPATGVWHVTAEAAQRNPVLALHDTQKDKRNERERKMPSCFAALLFPPGVTEC